MRHAAFGYSDYWVVSHSGDDNYVYAVDDDTSSQQQYGYGLLMFDKSDYSWKQYRSSIEAAETLSGYSWPDIIQTSSAACFDADYGYYLTWAYDSGGNGGLRVVRFRRGDPSDIRYIQHWPIEFGVTDMEYNATTGRRKVFDEDFVGGFDGAAMAYHNGKFYIIESGSDDFVDGWAWASIREWDGHGDTTKLLYWYDTIRAVSGPYARTPDLARYLLTQSSYGTTRGPVFGSFDRKSQPVAGVGYVGMRPHPKAEARVKDGWLYWLDVASYNSSQGMYFCRIDLDQLLVDYEKSGPVEHDPGNPRFEILCNGSAPWEGDGKWVEKTEYGVLWREGSSPIYNTLDNNWFFDEDGAIVFQHEEFPAWDVGSEYTRWVISRLVPPSAGVASVGLVFEGQALKGYSRVRQQQTAWAPEGVTLK
jgi:hypothetical protein